MLTGYAIFGHPFFRAISWSVGCVCERRISVYDPSKMYINLYASKTYDDAGRSSSSFSSFTTSGSVTGSKGSCIIFNPPVALRQKIHKSMIWRTKWKFTQPYGGCGWWVSLSSVAFVTVIGTASVGGDPPLVLKMRFYFIVCWTGMFWAYLYSHSLLRRFSTTKFARSVLFAQT